MLNLGYKAEDKAAEILGAVHGTREQDIEQGIDLIGLDGVTFQVKTMLHSDAGESALHGYSVANNTVTRKNKSDFFVLFLPCVLSYSPRYKLSHDYYLIYKIKVSDAKKYKIFSYSGKFKNVYMPKIKRLILDEMEKIGKCEVIGYGKTADLL